MVSLYKKSAKKREAEASAAAAEKSSANPEATPLDGGIAEAPLTRDWAASQSGGVPGCEDQMEKDFMRLLAKSVQVLSEVGWWGVDSVYECVCVFWRVGVASWVLYW